MASAAPTAPVLVGVDRSDAARGAALLGALLAEQLGAPLVLVHASAGAAGLAAPPAGIGAVAHAPLAYAPAEDAAAREHAQRLLDDVAAALPADVAGAAELVGDVGDPALRLADLAVQRGAQLVVVGAHRRRALSRALHGTVWCRLASDGPCPVVVVAEGAEVSAHGPIVVGRDDGPESEGAEEVAGGLAHRLGEELVAVRVPADADDPPAALEAAADDRRARLLAVGTRGRGPWRAALLGSVSGELVERARRPVMIVPPPPG